MYQQEVVVPKPRRKQSVPDERGVGGKTEGGRENPRRRRQSVPDDRAVKVRKKAPDNLDTM